MRFLFYEVLILWCLSGSEVKLDVLKTPLQELKSHSTRLVIDSPPPAPLVGVVEKVFEWVKATLLKGKPHKGNPPYPPCQGSNASEERAFA